MYRTVKLFANTGNVNDRKRSGWPSTARIPQIINAVRSRINRNPVRKQKIMATEMGIAPRTISCIIKQELGLGAFKRKTALYSRIKKKKERKASQLLLLYGIERYKQMLKKEAKF